VKAPDDIRARVDAALGFDVDDAEILRCAARDVRRVDPRLATIGHTALAEALDRAAARAEGFGALALAVRAFDAAHTASCHAEGVYRADPAPETRQAYGDAARASARAFGEMLRLAGIVPGVTP
jgi:uncharacterized protein YecT (DUF1311 family)